MEQASWVMRAWISRAIVQAALEKVWGENKVPAAIRAGMSMQEAWDQFGIM